MLKMLVAAAVVDASSLDLDLICPGQYFDTETTTASVQHNHDFANQSQAKLTTEVARPGTARIKFKDGLGEFVYPDGRRRELSELVADDQRITAQYTRRVVLINYTWRLQIDRFTGDVRLASGDALGFLGTCSAAPTKPKF